MVSPTAGRSSGSGCPRFAATALAMSWFATMPPMAWAPLASTWREIELRPCTSVTEYIIMMSLGPTYCLTSPEATVEIITLGRPMGNRRMPGVTKAVPPLPPAETMPAISR